MSRPAYVVINHQAYQHNLQKVREFAANKTIVAVVKANAYGHGIAQLIESLCAVDALGVCCLEEALELREQGLKQTIILLEGFYVEDELAFIVKNNLQTVVHCPEQIAILEKAKLTKPIFTWLKINTGMNRLGFSPQDFSQAWQRLNNLAIIEKPIGLMTHFSDADDFSNLKTLTQWQTFNEITATIAGPKSLANSAAILAYPQTQGDWVRPGIILYGVSPFANKTGLDYGLKPVMTLHSELIAVQDIPADSAVGYGSTWISTKPCRIGVVAMGYADGYPRHAKNGTPVLVNGKEVSLVGRVSMDMLTVDLTTQPFAKIGDPVILWGEGLPIETVAISANTIPYQLLCGINKRVKSYKVCDR